MKDYDNKELLKKINSDTIMVFNDFMRMLKLPENKYYDDIKAYYLNKSLNSLILDLITDNEPTVTISAKYDENGKLITNGLGNRILIMIEWIKNNLDVWNVEELEYNKETEKRTFIFKRKDYE
jgi:hypothetical protein